MMTSLSSTSSSNNHPAQQDWKQGAASELVEWAITKADLEPTECQRDFLIGSKCLDLLWIGPHDGQSRKAGALLFFCVGNSGNDPITYSDYPDGYTATQAFDANGITFEQLCVFLRKVADRIDSTDGLIVFGSTTNPANRHKHGTGIESYYDATVFKQPRLVQEGDADRYT